MNLLMSNMEKSQSSISSLYTVYLSDQKILGHGPAKLTMEHQTNTNPFCNMGSPTSFKIHLRKQGYKLGDTSNKFVLGKAQKDPEGGENSGK